MIECYSIIWTYHILFIHSSVDGDFGYVYLLVIVNNAAVNIGVQMPVLILACSSSGYMLRIGTLDHMVILYLAFWETDEQFSTAVALLYIPTGNAWGSMLLLLYK